MDRIDRKTVKAAHRATLMDRLQRRIEAARRTGNEVLLRQLEIEAKYLQF